MKKTLIVGLGNPLLIGDGVGARLVQALGHSALPHDLELLQAGTDLLRVAEKLRGRELIVLVDAAATESYADTVVVCDHGSPRLLNTHWHAHHLSAVQALELIRWADESVREARCVWFLPIVNPPDTTARTAP